MYIKENTGAHEMKIHIVCLLDSAPRCTPPIPPVTNTRIPALCAAIIVADTVVPPVSFYKHQFHHSPQFKQIVLQLL